MPEPDNRAGGAPDKGCYQASPNPEDPARQAGFLAVPHRTTGAVDPADIAGSFARNTKRAYAADWRAWVIWCGVLNRNALPASPADVAEYLKSRAERGIKVASLKRAVAALAQVHRLAGLKLDRDDEALHFALKRLAREYGLAAKGKAPLRLADIEAMLTALAGDGLAQVRDRALVLVGFAAALRRSELAALDVGDVAWHRDGIHLTIRTSKGDQDGRGARVPVHYGTRERTCPVRALKRWLDRTGLTEGPLFRPIRGRRVGDHRLSGEAVNDAVKSAARRAGLDARAIGAHSMRAGHATVASENGADLVRIKDQLRHKRVETTAGYVRLGDALRTSTSRKLGI